MAKITFKEQYENNGLCFNNSNLNEMLGRGRESIRWHGMRDAKEVTADEKIVEA